MKSDFTLAFNEIVEERALPKEKVLEALSQALVSAYKRDAKVIDSQRVEADIDPTGKPRLLVEKEVVQGVMNPQTEVDLEEAREVDPTAQEGDMLMVPVTQLSKNFGRIAAQTAKQVILQHIREAERETLYNEYIDRVGELVIGTVQSVNQHAVTFDLGRAEAVMPARERMSNERYRQHDKVRVYLVEVKRSNRGPQIVVSRNHKNMLRRLLEYEVPEIYNGLIEIKNIAREAGHRSKVAVAALQEGVDAVGACVGMRGMRIQNIVKELNDEKIDIIEWDPDASRFIARALSPARVNKVFLEEGLDGVRTATVIVPEDQLSLAIGKEGQNARLAAKLTGWRIDIKSVVEAAMSAIMGLHQPPLSALKERHAALVDEAFRILEKKEQNRAVTPEEYTSLAQFVEAAEALLHRKRETTRKERRQQIDMVRPLVPEPAFMMELSELELAYDIMKVIGFMGNVGELWVRFMADEEGLQIMLDEGGAGKDAMDAIRDALDDLVIPEVVAPKPADEPSPAEEAAIVEDLLDEPPAAEKLMEASSMDVELVAPIAGEENINEVARTEELPAQVPDILEDEDDQMPPLDDDRFLDENFDYEEDVDLGEVVDDKKGKKKGPKKGKQRRRQLIFDEDMGEVVAKRRRKRGTDDDYEEYF